MYKELRLCVGYRRHTSSGKGCEWVSGFGGCLGDTMTAVACRGWNDHKTMPSGGKGEATHPSVRGGGVDSMPTSINF